MRLRAGAALLALVATACGQGAGGEAQQTTTPTESPSPSPTPIDRTYTEFTTYEYRGEREDPFDIDYPSGWYTNEPNNPGPDAKGWAFSFSTAPPEGAGEGCPPWAQVAIVVVPEAGPGDFPEAQAEREVGGEVARLAVHAGADPALDEWDRKRDMEDCLTLLAQARFVHRGTRYTIGMLSQLEPTESEEELFDRMLDSFRFIP